VPSREVLDDGFEIIGVTLWGVEGSSRVVENQHWRDDSWCATGDHEERFGRSLIQKLSSKAKKVTETVVPADVPGVPVDMPTLEGRFDGIGIENCTTSSVNDPSTLFDVFEGVSVNHVTSILVKAAVYGNKIALGQEFLNQNQMNMRVHQKCQITITLRPRTRRTPTLATASVGRAV
jgi:hypothetical protein